MNLYYLKGIYEKTEFHLLSVHLAARSCNCRVIYKTNSKHTNHISSVHAQLRSQEGRNPLSHQPVLPHVPPIKH